MAVDFGLRVWDAGGALTLNTPDRVMRFISQHSYQLAWLQDSVTISVSGMVNDGTWVVLPLTAHHWAVVNNGYFTVQRFGDYGTEAAIATVFRY